MKISIIEFASSDSEDKINHSMDKNPIYFAHPILFDVLLTELTGNTIYNHVKENLSSFIYKSKMNQMSSLLSSIKMFLKLSKSEEVISLNDDVLKLTNDARNVATINVELAEMAYCSYIDKELAVKYDKYDDIQAITT